MTETIWKFLCISRHLEKFRRLSFQTGITFSVWLERIFFSLHFPYCSGWWILYIYRKLYSNTQVLCHSIPYKNDALTSHAISYAQMTIGFQQQCLASWIVTFSTGNDFLTHAPLALCMFLCVCVCVFVRAVRL